MPIYAYRCGSCGHAKDVLQKLSDPLLTTCPACGAEAFNKQLTAAGFQLKGSGWYATDFKGGGATTAAAGASGADKPGGDKSASEKSSSDKSGGDKPGGDSKASSSDSGSGPAASGGCGGSCACH